MAKREDNVEHEPLTEEQRITALEEKVGTNKLVLIGMALFLIIIVSVSATIFIISIFGEDEDATANSQMISALETRLIDLEKTLENFKKQNVELRNELSALNVKVTNSSNLKLQQLMIEQEQGHQVFIDALRTGMYDLAHMIPGSRTWLEVYGEKLDTAERHSKDREKELINLQKGLVTAKPKTKVQEDPFEDGF